MNKEEEIIVENIQNSIENLIQSNRLTTIIIQRNFYKFQSKD